jgi:hypothetical protein
MIGMAETILVTVVNCMSSYSFMVILKVVMLQSLLIVVADSDIVSEWILLGRRIVLFLHNLKYL